MNPMYPSPNLNEYKFMAYLVSFYTPTPYHSALRLL